MALSQQELDALQIILDTSTNDAEKQAVRDDLTQEGYDVVNGQIQLIGGGGSVTTSTRSSSSGSSSSGQSSDQYLAQAFELIQKALESGGKGVDKNEVDSLIKTYIDTNKIHKEDLSSDVIAFIEDTKKYEIKLPELDFRKTSSIFPEPITSLILSDLLSKNNVYLYGGAGTGKTFIAEAIGEEMLNCKVYTLPCNQYTSPLDLIGGQTIDGYQEGIVTRAYGCLDVPDDKSGALLILDELPKLDPNTAGVLNDMLAKVRRGKGITNGRQEIINRPQKKDDEGNTIFTKSFYVIATGNILLNREDPAYSGNTKQDLSLQDRFAGSCYEFIIELKSEKAGFIGFLFIWNYLVKLRFKIMELHFDNFAFVSRRLMESVRETHAFYMAQKKKPKGSDETPFPAKTCIQAMESFFSLFLPDQVNTLKNETNYDAWKLKAIEYMNKPEGMEFIDDADDIKESDALVSQFMSQQLAKYSYLKPMG